MKRRAAAVLAVGVGVTLAGCGDDGDGDNGVAELEADGILAEAQEAIDSAESASMVGTGTVEGEALELDISVGSDSGVAVIGQDGAEFEITLVDGNAYMIGDAAAWESMGAGAFADLVADKYVLIPQDDPSFAEFAEFLDFSALTSELLVPEGEITKGDETEIDGQPVIGVEDEDGSTLYIATTGDPLPVQVTSPEGGEGTLNFEWDVEIDVTAPDESEVVDLSELL